MCLIMTADGWKNLGDGVVCVNHNNVEGVYRNVPHDVAVAETMIRVNQFCAVVDTGDMTAIKNFNGHRLYGAFGEKL